MGQFRAGVFATRREHAKSGVSGVLPKFLDTEQKNQVGLGPWNSTAAFEGISGPPKFRNPRTVIDRSELLVHRAPSLENGKTCPIDDKTEA